MKKGDFILIALLIIGAVALSQWLGFSKALAATEVQIVRDGEVIEKYVIDKNFSKTVDISYGEYHNTIVIENGEVKMQEANCPDQLCVKSHAISKDGEMIVCLPHKLYVKMVANDSSDASDVDIISS